MSKAPRRRAKDSSSELSTAEHGDTNESVSSARTSLKPEFQAAATISFYGASLGDLDFPTLLDTLSEQINATYDGDLKQGEAMLTAQAHTLDAMFNTLARRALEAASVEHLEAYLKLGLRAQSQCRSTWEALSTVKYPPMMGYVKQANIAQGPQQVNNHTANKAQSSTMPDSQTLQNKLLEENDGQRLDTGAKTTPSGIDSTLETVEHVDRTQNARRQKNRRT